MEVSADIIPMQYIEAAWAEQMQPDQATYIETEDDEWRGIVRGPLSIAITIANDVLFCLDEDEVAATRAAWMTNLARHVLPRTDSFESWLDIVTERLARYHPRQGSEGESFENDPYTLGRPVARELFDSTRAFDPAEESLLIQRFLAEVDPTNPFLAVNTVEDEE